MAGNEVNTFNKAQSSTTDTNARVMLLPAKPVRKPRKSMEAFLVSTGVVALAEIGDKTQLLALVLAARFRAPVPVILGILTATLANHLAAGAVGTLLASHINPQLMRYLLAASFFATAVWMFIPDREPDAVQKPARFGAYGTTVVSFFLLEIGDKTQLATVALAAKYQMLIPVVAGTTLGMMLADIPAVFFAGIASSKIPFMAIRIIAAVLFAALGIGVIAGLRLG